MRKTQKITEKIVKYEKNFEQIPLHEKFKGLQNSLYDIFKELDATIGNIFNVTNATKRRRRRANESKHEQRHKHFIFLCTLEKLFQRLLKTFSCVDKKLRTAKKITCQRHMTILKKNFQIMRGAWPSVKRNS